MANHKSAIKRARQSVKRNALNRARRAKVHTLTKAVETVATQGDAQKTRETLRKAESALAKAAARGTLHKKTAARKMSRLAKRIKKVSASKV